MTDLAFVQIDIRNEFAYDSRFVTIKWVASASLF